MVLHAMLLRCRVRRKTDWRFRWTRIVSCLFGRLLISVSKFNWPIISDIQYITFLWFYNHYDTSMLPVWTISRLLLSSFVWMSYTDYEHSVKIARVVSAVAVGLIWWMCLFHESRPIACRSHVHLHLPPVDGIIVPEGCCFILKPRHLD